MLEVSFTISEQVNTVSNLIVFHSTRVTFTIELRAFVLFPVLFEQRLLPVNDLLLAESVAV